MDKILTFNGKIATGGGRWITRAGSTPDPYNPLDLPEYTIRLKFYPDATPYFRKGYPVRVSLDPNVWDLTYPASDWNNLLMGEGNLMEVLGANTSGVRIMSYMFQHCDHLLSVALFDTRQVEDMSYMFQACNSLTAVPLLDTGSVDGMNSMLDECYDVQSGALALYQQASSQVSPPSSHSFCFSNCGIHTVTGAAELAQIPVSWGGTMS